MTAGGSEGLLEEAGSCSAISMSIGQRLIRLMGESKTDATKCDLNASCWSTRTKPRRQIRSRSAGHADLMCVDLPQGQSTDSLSSMPSRSEEHTSELQSLRHL